MPLKFFKKCGSQDCKYSIHSNINNNNGKFCCKMCEKNSSHGPNCEKKMNMIRKIFVIGFNKTGTTSIHNLFLNEKIKSAHTVKPVTNILDKYEAFTDGVHYNFQEYYNKYPESLFILNTRPLKKWLISRYKHACVKPSTQFVNMANSWLKYNKKNMEQVKIWPPNNEITYSWLEEHEYHFKNVLRFFENKPHQLFIVNIERVGWENKVLEFIKQPTQTEIKSYFYKRDDSEIDKEQLEQIYSNVKLCLENKGYNGDELLIKDNSFSIAKYNNYL